MRLVSTWLLAASGLAACAQGRDAGTRTDVRDAAADAESALVDAPADRASSDQAVIAPVDAQAAPADARPDRRPAPSGLPLPADVPAPRKFLDAAARLTGHAVTSCSHQEPASGDGDRWCVFMVAPTELWVIDISRAASGEIPRCDGSSPACLRLTTNLWTSPVVVGRPVHPYSHEFHGDTLIFYADALSGPNELHRGPVFAWRPGWPRARRISTERAVICWGHARAAVAHCLEDFSGDPMLPDSIEVRAGPLAETGETLPSLGRIRPYRTGGVLALQAGFSPPGDLFLLSSADPDPAVESLRVIATGELGRATPREIVRGATSWEIGKAGGKIFYYRVEGADDKSLYVADFPSGANETKLASKVDDYLTLGDATTDRGVAFLENLAPRGSALRLLRDVRMPASAATVFAYGGMLEGVEVSPDVRFTAWSDMHFNMRIVRHADATSCDLNMNPRHDAFAPWFLDSAGLVFWKEESDDGPDRLDGYLANPDGCQAKRRFGLGVDFTMPVGDRALVFGDELDDLASTVTLKYAALAAGREWPAAGPVRVHGDVDNSSVILVGTKPLLVVFRVAAGGAAEEGTYVFGLPP